MSKKSIENEYKRFLQTAERWKELVVANSVFHDRKKYGKSVEERYGYTFTQTMYAAKLW